MSASVVDNVPWLGLATELGGPCAYFADDAGLGALHAFFNFHIQLSAGNIMEPILPAEFLRVTSRGGEPPVLFYETGQRHVTTATQVREFARTAAAESPVEDGTAVAFAKALEPSLVVFDELRDCGEDFFRKLEPVWPREYPGLFLENQSPLPIADQLQTKDSQGKEAQHFRNMPHPELPDHGRELNG